MIDDTIAPTLQGFVYDNTKIGAEVYTDDAAADQGMIGVLHGTVKHSVGEYVNGQIHTNGTESFWAMLKRGYRSVYH